MNSLMQRTITGYWRKRFLHSLHMGAETQRALLLQILQTQAHTALGTQYAFAHISSVQQYQQELPLSSYEDLAPWIARILTGEPGVLTSQPVSFLLATSGTTTGQYRLLPGTALSRWQVSQALLTAQGFLHAWMADQGLTWGRGLILGSTLPFCCVGQAHLPVLPASASCISAAAPAWKALSSFPFGLTQIVDPEARFYLSWRFALQRRTSRSLSAPYMASLLAFALSLFQQSETLLRDFADGTVNRQIPLSAAQRRAWRSGWRKDRNMLLQLERLAALYGGLLPCFIWPELEWLLVVDGPSFLSYKPLLQEWYHPHFFWGMPYMACEGIVGMPIMADSASHVPALQTTFLEFVPEEACTEAQPRTVLLHELVAGARYEVVLTGWNGLYRYRLGDLVEVDGQFCGVPTFKVISRIKTVLSIAWEKTSEGQIVQAVMASTQDSGRAVMDFVVDIDSSCVPACYCLWLEPVDSSLPPTDTLSALFDAQLCQVNPSYARLRRSAEIGEPLVRMLPCGTFARFRLYQQQRGMPPDQMKIVHSTPHWEYIASAK